MNRSPKPETAKSARRPPDRPQDHTKNFNAVVAQVGKSLFPGLKGGKAAKCIIFILLSVLGARAQAPKNSGLRIPDSRFKRQATASAPAPSWTNRRLYKLIAIGALRTAGAFDAYETNSLIGDLPPTVSVVNGATTSTTAFKSEELNPLLRPFAGHWTLYPAVEAGDGLLSAWLLRARGSRSRKAAWIAVSVQIGLHIGLGINNWRQHDAQWATFHGASVPGAGAPAVFGR